VAFIGTELGLEASLVPAAGFEFHPVPARPLVRKASPAALRAPAVALRATRAARKVVGGSDAVVGMGGYASVPAVLAAAREGVPVVLHEQNAVPGLANRALARYATVVALSFAATGPGFRTGVLALRLFGPPPRLVVTGNPIREQIRQVLEERDQLRKEALVEFGLGEDRSTVVIFGGSLGALHLDRSAIGACRVLSGRGDLQVLLITGPAHLDSIQRGLAPGEGGGILVRLVGYLDRMELAYAVADLVVARAGATTIAEITACGLPALLVPYPHATRAHQEANARALQRAGGASAMRDEQLDAESLADRIESLIDHRERLEAMAERSRAFGRPGAAEELADTVMEVAGGHG
jgi:UDP-N-acetylglucosamine--N-acetylmuramyl-(pentapeptide) pyrophosphoryl-undecaprenol N-acetylglucosamine transferase